jgi:hypothetical protein
MSDINTTPCQKSQSSPVPMTDDVFCSETIVQIPIATKLETTGENRGIGTEPVLPMYPNSSHTYYAEIPPEDIHLQKCWQYGKSVKYMACIDVFICVMNSMVSLPWLLCAAVPLLGYYGAKQYNINKILAYGLYSGLLLIARVGILYGIYSGNFDSSSKIMTDGGIFLCWISTFARLWITHLVYKFGSILRSLNQQQHSILQIGTYVPVTTSILYY